ncbi:MULTISPECIES: relaxase/mobilization nuclease domain-containing protein [Flavobacteriaceae]|uniref:relaxase/mobilization nuclease domain-containing protein n=1 Tax=Flavobacteriaceae TaxID=49546 RepID=UPI001492915B|nr:MULTISPECIES: relaxase/mobilization nuclease domain-containing protein [Allomuricauda]MDC6364867.1 relaxase/mobilization nuclease domain-containing protein [Muricauda sp. AC10]
MIGKGKSISHTRASIGYGWNQEKNAEIIHRQHVAGLTPKEITQEFKIIQEQNTRCKNNTLSFVLSPTIEDGKNLSQKRLKELTHRFIKRMKLGNNQAIAFVHRDKQHIHIHLYVNRIGFNGKAYKDNFIGKWSQLAAQEVAKEMGLTTVKEVQQEKQNELGKLRSEIKRFHEKVMAENKPRDFDQYIKYMKRYKVKVIPYMNKSNKLQGFRFEYKGQNLKGSEVHRSMSINNLALQLSKDNEKGILMKGSNTIQLMGKTVELSANIALHFTKKIIKKTIKKGLETGIGI